MSRNQDFVDILKDKSEEEIKDYIDSIAETTNAKGIGHVVDLLTYEFKSYEDSICSELSQNIGLAIGLLDLHVDIDYQIKRDFKIILNHYIELTYGILYGSNKIFFDCPRLFDSVVEPGDEDHIKLLETYLKILKYAGWKDILDKIYPKYAEKFRVLKLAQDYALKRLVEKM